MCIFDGIMAPISRPANCFPQHPTETRQMTPTLDLERLGHVTVGGFEGVRLSCEDYDYAFAASKPSAMTLRLLEKPFSEEVLLRSTLQETKEFSGLDQTKIAANNGMLMKFVILLR